MLRGTNLTFIYPSTYDICEMKNCCRGSRHAGSPVPGETLPGRRSGQRKLPQLEPLSPAVGQISRFPGKKYSGNWEEPQQIKATNCARTPSPFSLGFLEGSGTHLEVQFGTLSPTLLPFLSPLDRRSYLSLSISHPQIQHHCT